jgi:glycosyltransferase involved in cell wall biosynthesis
VRILHVSQPTEAGVALVVRQLVADQVRRGWDVVVACPADGPLAGEVREVGARHEEWPAGRAPGVGVVRESAWLRRIVWEFTADVVHLHSSKAGLAGRLMLRGRLPTVFEPNGWSFLVGGGVGAAALRWERLADRWCDAVVCVSEGEREIGERAGIGGRQEVIPNAVDLETFAPATAADRRSARARLGLPEVPLVVCVGRLSRQKGQDVLLEAWPSVTARVPEARLVLVGGGPDEEALVERAVERVRLVGHRHDVPDWLAAADVVALPSRWEGLSLVLLQAMARGRSVVTADVAGAREVLSGGAGGVVAIEDADGLADALVARLLNPALAAAEGEAGRRVAVERHDVRSRTERMSALYA